jgi:FtsP/CotA-like multicopper oxidase with cupredoxin domain
MFYHDHAWGITRLNVYAGEAAGYIITDAAEQAMQAAGTIPPMADTIPLIIQDKTFVNPANIMVKDPTWAWGSVPPTPFTGPTPTVSGEGMNPVLGDLWWPHVYMTAQNPFNPNFSGINDFGRWHYGPWFNPPTLLCGSGPDIVVPWCVTHAAIDNPYYNPACDPADLITNPTGFCQPPLIPGTPDVSWGAEAFLDTMMVNGTVYPTVTVDPKAYRLRILNASHDRFLNLQLYRAANKTGPTTPGAGTPIFTGLVTDLTEVAMVTAASTSGFPADWPTDDREGGVPDPATSGPAMIQIGTEGGFLPGPVLLTNQPVRWNQDPAMFNVGNVLNWADGGGTLFLAPAERADVIVDFTNFAGHTLILYNDAPTAFPALVPQYDYFTGAPDRSDSGGYTEVLAGFGPNIRTVMQIVVTGTNGSAPVNDYNETTLSALQTAFTTTDGGPGVFAASQDPIVVGQQAYNAAYNVGFPYTYPDWGISNIFSTTLSFKQVDGTTVSKYPMLPKAIHDEMGGTFDDYGRMSAKLGLEVMNSNAALSTFSMQTYVDPATEFVNPGKIQIWKITHNGVDTHPIHFHLFDVQLINRVGWDGFIRLPDANELGWKDTLRISPLEDTIVAFRPVIPQVPFVLPESVRPLNPAVPLGSEMGFGQLDPLTGAALEPLQTNVMANFGFEYVWHCHILSHEENDMMRSTVFKVKDHIGVFRGFGEWYLDASGNGAWDALDKTVVFGTVGDTPVFGDWNGNAISKIGTFKDGVWTLDVNGNNVWDAEDVTYAFGIPGDIPVTGDWNGSGKTKIGVVRGTTWFFDMNGNGAWDAGDVSFVFGNPGDLFITGDWNGDGKTKIGVVRGTTWFFDMNGNGAWDDGIDAAYSFGNPGDKFITGDWSGNGKTKIGVIRSSTWYLDMNGNGAWDDGIDVAYSFGIPSDVPVISKW